MHRLTIRCKLCNQKALVLETYPALVQLLLDLLVRLATTQHGAFHPVGTKVDFEIKSEPVLIVTPPATLNFPAEQSD